jgi:hypothetical protein
MITVSILNRVIADRRARTIYSDAGTISAESLAATTGATAAGRIRGVTAGERITAA